MSSLDRVDDAFVFCDPRIDDSLSRRQIASKLSSMLSVQSPSNLTIEIQTQQHLLSLPRQLLSIVESTHLNVKLIEAENIVQPPSTLFRFAGANSDLELIRTVLTATFGQHIQCSITPVAAAASNNSSDLFSSIFKVEEIVRVSN